MKVSLNWVKQFIDFELPPVPELVDTIGAQLGAVEEVIDLGARYRGIVIVKVAECKALEGSDHLNVCLVDDGGKTPDVNREANGLVQVVCGAPNVRAGMLVAWLPPGSTVPSSYEKDPFVLGAKELRGFISNGMLASAKELAIGDSHEGLLELDANGKPGDDFAAAYGLDDTIIDIENKMFTHRPDAFGQLGVAREIAGILGQTFHSPDWYDPNATIAVEAPRLPLEVHNEIPGLVPRFTALVIDSIKVQPSPIWLQIALARMGLRPINNVVDLTNYFMLLTGQPLHAYDYAKVKRLSGTDTPTLVARNPRSSERLTLINGKTIDPRQEAIVIATDTTAIGLGGVMGGAETEVDDTTTAIILESASFDMYSVRRTSMAHGIFSDAVTRFNKGQSPLQNRAVLVKIAQTMQEITRGAIGSQLIDDNHLAADTLERASLHPPITVTTEYINVRLGLDLNAEAMATLLKNVEFTVAVDGTSLSVTAPFWRTDIELREDIVEEIGRLYGFDKLPLTLPFRAITPAPRDQLLELKQRLRSILSQFGANELLTYSFVHGDLLDKVGQDRALSYRLSNALSPDLQYYRQTLTPSLLATVHANIKAGYGEFAAFEIGKGHVLPPADGPNQPDHVVPPEFEQLALVYAADTKTAERTPGAAFYKARKYLDALANELGIAEQLSVLPPDPEHYSGFEKYKIAPYEPSRTATIVAGDIRLGEIGEYSAAVRRALKLPDHTAGFELDVAALAQLVPEAKTYHELPRFPSLSQDICLRVDAGLAYGDLYDFATSSLKQLQPQNCYYTFNPVDVYQSETDTSHKQVTFRLTISSYEKTLTDAEVSTILNGLASQAHDKFGAERV